MSGRRTLSTRHHVWLIQAAILAASAGLALAATYVGIAASIDRALEPLRFAVLTRDASKQVVVVEMDAASAAAIDRWPWPRANYAPVVDHLRRAGAASVVFDVDFSARSTNRDDATLAAALARADGLVVLPTFAQQARASDRRSLDAMPIPLLRPHVALASVSVSPDADGLVRDAPLGTMTYGQPHPSLSAYIAHRGGSADQPFPIDFGIDQSSVPRLSFIAVRDGHFDANRVRGRDVLIGATAIEMGDRYAVPRWGNLPGVVVQALAAETLRQRVPHRDGPFVPVMAALLIAGVVLAVRRDRTVAMVAVGGLAALFGLIFMAQARGETLPVGTALILLGTAIGGRVALVIAARFRQQRLVDEETGLPSRRALLDVPVTDGEARPLLVALIANFDSLAAVLPAGAEHQLVRRLAERLQFATGDFPVHRVAQRLLAVELVPDTDIAALAERLRPILLAPIEIAGRRVDAVVTLGSDVRGIDAAARLVVATLGAEDAARGGRFWRADGPDLAAVDKHVSLLGDLDRAVATGEITVVYQPKLALATQRIASAEALVRWQAPTGEMIPPSRFIPIAEQAGRIAPLTLHVLERVLADLSGWLAAGHDLTVAVNISAKLLGEPSFDEAVSNLMAASSVPMDRLLFEVTESAALDDSDAALRSLHRFYQMGISLSMDDYGTGQSTLSYLRDLPLSELKIDRAFVQHVAIDSKDEAMVRSTIELAHQLGLKVVAEGVEDAACLIRLAALGCDYAQGYHISRPVQASKLDELLVSTSRSAAA